MPSLAPILPHVEPFMLVLFRLGGLFIFAPMLASPIVPVRIRTLLVFMLTLALYPALTLPAAAAPRELDLFSLALAGFFEILIGAGIGLLASLPMFAVQLGGLVGGQQLGLGLAGIYNPALDTESDVLGQMFVYIALAVFAAAGGIELCFVALAHTFERIPPGAAWLHATAIVGGSDAQGGGAAAGLGDMLLGLISSGFEVALRVSAPVLGIVLVETLASAFIMKTIPQINIMSTGFAIKVVLGLFILVVSLSALGELIGDETRAVCDHIMLWATAAPP